MTIEISDIQLFTILKDKIGEREANTLIDYVKQETSLSIVKIKEILSKDIASLQIHIDGRFEKLESKFGLIDGKFDSLKTIIDEKFNTQDQKFENRVLQSKKEMLRAMYITSFIQIISIIGSIMALVKLLK